MRNNNEKQWLIIVNIKKKYIILDNNYNSKIMRIVIIDS